MLQCPKVTIARFFYNVSSSFFLLLIFFHSTSILLAKLFVLLGGNPFYQRNDRDGYEFPTYSDEEIEEENEYYGRGKFMEGTNVPSYESEELRGSSSDERAINEEITSEDCISEATNYDTPSMEMGFDDEEVVENEVLARDSHDSSCESDPNECDPTTRFGTNNSNRISRMEASNNGIEIEKNDSYVVENRPKTEMQIRQEERFLVYRPIISEGKKLMQEKDEIFGDTLTMGSTSKDSSEWRSSINCTEDPFSSSSRRSCPNWESYTVFQKYDEEMLFLDRISAQKLHETESLRSIQACPRSISDRIVHKITRTKSSKQSSKFQHTNPFHELESAYVAQICLTWEALNWNYKYFERLRASRREFDPGCPAFVAQQFQQFQVLLQRYIENEPYEHGKRPEIYARMRSFAPKLLQVPEYRDSDDERREDNQGSRIPSTSFLLIMDEAITTFMNFLKQDKKTHCQILAAFFKKNRRGSADATLLNLLKKVNKKKKAKLKELRSSGKCLRKRKLKQEDEFEILMAQIDLKVVSRVLRMAGLNDEQLHWCENKMSKVRVSDKKLQRDSSPLFFPAH